MKIVIPDDYQEIIDRLQCFALLEGHEITRYRTPARDQDELAARLGDAEVAVAIRVHAASRLGRVGRPARSASPARR